MKPLIFRVKDETEPTPEEVSGKALATVVDKLAKSNETLAKTLVQAITEALVQVQSKEIVVKNHMLPQQPMIAAPEPVREWVFTVKRDADGLLSQITAKAV